MSYIRAVKRTAFHQESSTTSQVISTTQTELSGSRFSYTPENSANSVIIQITQNFFPGPDWNSNLEFVLQERIDNFSTFNIISGSHGKIQAAGNNNNEYANGTDGWSFENQFILNSWRGRKSFRLMLKSSTTQFECQVQRSSLWNSSSPIDTYPPPLIFIKEI